VEKILAFIGRAERCQALAELATTDVQKFHLLKLAEMWLEFARNRRQLLILEGTYKPVDGGDNWNVDDWIAALGSEQ
jgi:hypothetical protein